MKEGYLQFMHIDVKIFLILVRRAGNSDCLLPVNLHALTVGGVCSIFFFHSDAYVPLFGFFAYLCRDVVCAAILRSFLIQIGRAHV